MEQQYIIKVVRYISSHHKCGFHGSMPKGSLIPRLSVGGERESLVSTVCACA